MSEGLDIQADRRVSRTGEDIRIDLLLAEIVDSLRSTAVWVFTPDTRVAWCGRRCTTVFGHKDPNQVVGMRPRDLLPTNWAAEREELIRRAFEEQREFTLLSIIGGRRQRIRFRPVPLGPDFRTYTHVMCVLDPIDADEVAQLLRENTNGTVTRSKIHDLGPLDVLSPRELEVLALIGQGMRSKDIAAALHRSRSTIEGHRERIGTKLGINDRAELMSMARQAALLVEDADCERVQVYGPELEPFKHRNGS